MTRNLEGARRSKSANIQKRCCILPSMSAKRLLSILVISILINSLSAQSRLMLADSSELMVQSVPYKTKSRLYFLKSDTLFYIHKSEFIQVINLYWDFENQVYKDSRYSQHWDNLIPTRGELENDSPVLLFKKYANRSSAGIVMTLVVPSVTSVLALQQGVVEIAYIGLASSVVGIGLWLSGINQLRTALELGEAIHYTH